MDKFTPTQRSAMMAEVKSKNTSIEKWVRSQVFKAGFRYSLNVRKLPGSPDLAFAKYRIAVFVHGCFWHGHHCKKGKLPKSNKEFWQNKIAGNKKRDERARAELKNLGWESVVIWGCQLEGSTEALIAKLKKKKNRLKWLNALYQIFGKKFR